MRIENLIREGREKMKRELGRGQSDTLQMIENQREKAKQFEAFESGSVEESSPQLPVKKLVKSHDRSTSTRDIQQ
jgi:hypothetical protein